MSNAISDPYLLGALWAGIAAVALTLLLTLAIVCLRLRLRADERCWEAFIASWRPPLLSALIEGGTPVTMPPLAARDHPLFLRLWAYLHESVRGDAAQLLDDTARRLGMDVAARGLLQRGSRAQRLQAVLAAGYLRDAQAWDLLVKLAQGSDSLLSVNAARALVRIEPLRAAETLMPLLISRTDWDLSRVASFLAEARSAFWLLMAKAIPQLGPQELPRALLLAQALRMQLPDATLVRLLQPGQPPAIVQAALRLADNLALAPQVRRCLAHADPGVREEAVRRMQRMAMHDDLQAMARLLDAPEWPVRMAAAQALSRLPFVRRDTLEALAAAHPDAAPMLRHAVAERGLG